MQCFGRAHLRRDVKRLRSQHSGDRTSAAARASRAAPAAAGPSPASPGGHRAVPVPRTGESGDVASSCLGRTPPRGACARCACFTGSPRPAVWMQQRVHCPVGLREHFLPWAVVGHVAVDIRTWASAHGVVSK